MKIKSEVSVKVPVIVNCIMVMIMCTLYELHSVVNGSGRSFAVMHAVMNVAGILAFMYCAKAKDIKDSVAEALCFTLVTVTVSNAAGSEVLVEHVLLIVMLLPSIVVAEKCALRFFPVCEAVRLEIKVYNSGIFVTYSSYEILYLWGYIILIGFVTVMSYIIYKHVERLTKRSRELAYWDTTMNCYNRNYWNAIADGTINTECKCLMYVDVDNFKSINDQYGHNVGDEVLADISKALTDIADKREAIIIRMGGDEFAILCKPLYQLDVRNDVCKIAKGYGKCKVKMSIGVSRYSVGSMYSYDEAYADADKDMYAHKCRMEE